MVLQSQKFTESGKVLASRNLRSQFAVHNLCVVIWVCPECERTFARNKQGHICAPAMTVEAYFAAEGPERERPIFEAVLAFAETLGPVLVEPVAVGIFLKRARTFVELRPKTKWIELSFGLHRRIDHSRISKIIGVSGGRTFHAVRLVTPEDVTEPITDWITEAYDLTPA
jgi:Domain of unknown function (DUF5655)